MMKALLRKTKEHLMRQEAPPSRASSLDNPSPNSPSTPVVADNTSRWVGVQDQPFYMAVVIREARNLTIGDAIQRSTDREYKLLMLKTPLGLLRVCMMGLLPPQRGFTWRDTQVVWAEVVLDGHYCPHIWVLSHSQTYDMRGTAVNCFGRSVMQDTVVTSFVSKASGSFSSSCILW